MGGKGRKRREKNYRAAHGGGQSRLPPPPVSSSLDAVPSKLRKLMSFSGPEKISVDSAAQRKRGDGGSENLVKDRANANSVNTAAKMEGTGGQHDSTEKGKKKRKRKPVDDLRFEAAELGAVGSKRKERKKKLLAERKKKHKIGKGDESESFHVHEEIRFGDVAQAPPKLVVPKGFKSRQAASQERIRLKAIEDYRNRRKWASRPGIQLPVPVLASPSE